MTSFPAQKYELWDRGLVRPGMWADLVVFDAATVLDRSTVEESGGLRGLPHVLVNGVFAVRDGQYTGARRQGTPRRLIAAGTYRLAHGRNSLRVVPASRASPHLTETARTLCGHQDR